MPSPGYKPYVENPYTGLLKEVHWPGHPATGLAIVFTAHLVGPPISEPQNTTSNMLVSVTHLPELARTTLEVGNPATVGGSHNVDQVVGSFSDPPIDPVGIIDGEYRLEYNLNAVVPAVTFSLQGDARYVTSATGAKRFGGASFIAISVTFQVREFYSGEFIAAASSSITPSQSLTGTISAAATVTAHLTFDPPSLSFG